MCFAPQRRALFRHLNFQKWSDAEVFCTFWLGNVLRATTACNFSSLIWPAGSAPAALASLLFDPPEPQIIGKTRCFATFLPFRASASSFFWSFLFWLFSPLLFNCPYCRKFHFLKLPSIIYHMTKFRRFGVCLEWNFTRWRDPAVSPAGLGSGPNYCELQRRVGLGRAVCAKKSSAAMRKWHDWTAALRNVTNVTIPAKRESVLLMFPYVSFHCCRLVECVVQAHPEFMSQKYTDRQVCIFLLHTCRQLYTRY